MYVLCKRAYCLSIGLPCYSYELENLTLILIGIKSKINLLSIIVMFRTCCILKTKFYNQQNRNICIFYSSCYSSVCVTF